MLSFDLLEGVTPIFSSIFLLHAPLRLEILTESPERNRPGPGGTDAAGAAAMIMGEVKLVGQDTRFSDVHDEWLSGMAWHGATHYARP